MAEIKIGGKTRFENLLKQLFHSPLLDMYSITSYPTRAHGIIVIYLEGSTVESCCAWSGLFLSTSFPGFFLLLKTMATRLRVGIGANI